MKYIINEDKNVGIQNVDDATRANLIKLCGYESKVEDEKPLEGIQAQASKIRHEIGQKIRNQLRAIPEFVYYLDDSLDYIDRIDNLLKE